MARPYGSSSLHGEGWINVGLTSSFPNISDSGSIVLAEQVSCDDKSIGEHGCKVFLAPDAEDGNVQATQLSEHPNEQVNASLRKGHQVLVFQYRGKFHAVDNKCPHSSYPLSNGTPFDIEDFGVTLSAGITCPKHEWSFDLFTGLADRGNYKLKLWEVQLRKVTGNEEDRQVWVRRKQRMG
ncbi:hypothetical protein BT63DRAFT_86472 [Microthyrium microscopicum]|uniref:Rieske domain-containing protein n=1 Tax=Microthyrium microscopicum TaxID=703497 RepID=A0A6A6U0H7_9PEZI|nr:hypothetical protein BT63DRAFT_86472 [Microthyrium microscopicum]